MFAMMNGTFSACAAKKRHMEESYNIKHFMKLEIFDDKFKKSANTENIELVDLENK